MPARLLVTDANILIDMDAGGLLRSTFRLKFALAVPDTLFEEELREAHAELRYLGLKTLELDGETVEYVARAYRVFLDAPAHLAPNQAGASGRVWW